jgi:hypothetical protein
MNRFDLANSQTTNAMSQARAKRTSFSKWVIVVSLGAPLRVGNCLWTSDQVRMSHQPMRNRECGILARSLQTITP